MKIRKDYKSFGVYNKNGWYYINPFFLEINGTFLLIFFMLASSEKEDYLGPNLGLASTTVVIILSGKGGGISGCSLKITR